MKNLRNYCVRVSNDVEREIAQTFYRRAMKKALSPNSYTSCSYVGMGTHRFDKNHVFCGVRDPRETVVEFDWINTLADSPSRQAALDAAFRKHNPATGSNPRIIRRGDGVEENEPVKTPSKKLPTVRFWYPSSSRPHMKIERDIRLVKADGFYLIGFDINNGEKFKKFKRSKISGEVKLVLFNS